MRSRALAVVLTLLSLGAFTAATFFIRVSEQQIESTRRQTRTFDEAVDHASLTVAAFDTDSASSSIASLRAIATTDETRASLDAAATEAADADISPVIQRLDEARAAEKHAAEGAEATRRRFEAIAIAGSGAFAVLAIAALALAWPRATAPQAEETASVLHLATAAPPKPAAAIAPAEEVRPSGYTTARTSGPVLRKAAELCTNIGRVNDVEELQRLVTQAADIIDASGVIVWVNVPSDTALRPALLHGYSSEMVSRLPPLSRTGDNAVARAFRSGQLQIILARPGASNGALAAPLMTPTGCAGVFSAEIRGGGESSETVQSLTAIFAAQLATVLPSAPASVVREPAAATGTGGI